MHFLGDKIWGDPPDLAEVQKTSWHAQKSVFRKSQTCTDLHFLHKIQIRVQPKNNWVFVEIFCHSWVLNDETSQSPKCVMVPLWYKHISKFLHSILHIWHFKVDPEKWLIYMKQAIIKHGQPSLCDREWTNIFFWKMGNVRSRSSKVQSTCILPEPPSY